MAKEVTGKTTRPAGIIQFGSNDEAVIFQEAMTDSAGPSNGAAFGTGVSFDENGMNTNGTGGWTFDLSALDFNTLERSGQFSFDVLSSTIATAKAYISGDHSGSNGTVPDAPNDYLLSWSTDGVTSSTNQGRLFMSGTNTLALQMENNNSTFIPTELRLTDHGKDTYATVTISWQGTTNSIYIDGAPHYKFTNGINLPADLFKYFHIGSNEERASGDILSAGRYIKNFVVSNRPVMLAGHPMLRKPVIMGDSFGVATEDETTASTNRFDHQISYQIKAALALKGLRLGSPTTNYPSSNAGHSVNGTVIDDTGTAAAAISDTTAAVLAEKPSIVILYGGINDVRKPTGYDIAVFETKYKSLVNALLAPTSSVQKLFIVNIVSHRGDFAQYTATAIARTAEVNAVVNALPGWWDGANPSDTGRVIVIDAFNGFFAEDTTAIALQTTKGTWNPGNAVYGNDLHPSSMGGRIIGRLLGHAIHANLS